MENKSTTSSQEREHRGRRSLYILVPLIAHFLMLQIK